MTFANLAAGASVFVDANTFIYHFAPHAIFGPPCAQLIQRIENQDLLGFTSTHVLSEVAHRMMAFEAMARFGWPSKAVNRLKQNATCVQQLTQFRRIIEEIPQLNVQILTIPAHLVATATAVSQQTGLLSNDALIVAVIQANGLANLASEDTDFDRVPGLTRYAPV